MWKLGFTLIFLCLKIINQNSYRILKLVNNISDDNRIDLGHSNYSPTNANIIYFIEDICESIEPFVKSNNMNIVFDTDIEELIISFDMEKMERIILNLISNAVKFRKENKGKIINFNSVGKVLTQFFLFLFLDSIISN